MRIRTIALISTLVLLIAACGGGTTSDGTEQSATSVTAATTSAPPSSTAPTTAVTTAPSTTSTVAETTSTTRSPTAQVGTLGALLAAPDTTETAPKSARFDARIDMDVEDEAGDLQTVSIAFSGAYDDRTESSDITIDMSAMADLAGLEIAEDDPFSAMILSMFTEPMRVITIGDVAWIKWSFFTTFLGAEEGKWLEGEADENSQPVGDLGFGAAGGTPADFLDVLADANADVTEVGPDDVRGWPTTHYRVLLDLEALAADATPEERAELEAAIGDGFPAEFPMDLWIGDDGYPYRFTMEVDTSIAAGEVDGLSRVTVFFEMYDYDEVIDISAPDPDDVISEDELGFDFGLGG